MIDGSSAMIQTGSTSARTATALAVAATVEVLLFTILSTVGTGTAGLVGDDLSTTSLIAIPFAAVGALIVRRDRAHVLGWIFVALGQLCALNALGFAWGQRGLPGHALAVWLGAYLWVPALLLQTATLTLYFPAGRLPSPRWRPVAIVAWLTVALGTIGSLASAGPLRDADPTVRNPFAVPAFDATVALAVFGVLFAIAVGCFLAGLVGAIARARTSPGPRAALWWVIGSFLITVLGTVIGGIPNLVGALAIPLGLGIATLRYGLYGGDQFTGRTAIHTVVAVTIVGVLGVAIGTLADRIGGGGIAAVLAAVVIALGLSPAQRWIGHRLDRLFYGDRLEPHLALSRLGRRLEDTLSTDEVLGRIVATVRDSLRLPWVAITLSGDDEPSAASGTPAAAVQRVSLSYCGERVATLEVGLPQNQSALDLGDEALLRDLAGQAGAAVGAVLFTRDLQRSRERMLVAREEERQRVRQDLHDGLGPTLAGIALGLGSAQRALANRKGVVAADLGALAVDVDHALDDLKRIVNELAPIALDQLGLVETLRHYADALSASGPMRVAVAARGTLPELPASLEVAAYFVAREAINNAVRHSGGTRCEVAVEWDTGLTVRVSDDGRGLPAQPPRGVGLDSMRRRAAELGGHLELAVAAAGGTCVTLRLPSPS